MKALLVYLCVLTCSVKLMVECWHWMVWFSALSVMSLPTRRWWPTYLYLHTTTQNRCVLTCAVLVRMYGFCHVEKITVNCVIGWVIWVGNLAGLVLTGGEGILTYRLWWFLTWCVYAWYIVSITVDLGWLMHLSYKRTLFDKCILTSQFWNLLFKYMCLTCLS